MTSLPSLSEQFGLPRADAFAWSFAGFAAVLAAATFAAARCDARGSGVAARGQEAPDQKTRDA